MSCNSCSYLWYNHFWCVISLYIHIFFYFFPPVFRMTQTSLETWCCKYAYWYCFWIISEFSLEIISKLDLLILTITRLQSPHLSFRGPRFELMASGTLELTDIGDSIGNYDLQLTSGADVTTCELPLFGVFCLRLACQPECLVEPVATGYLNLLVCSLHYFFIINPPLLYPSGYFNLMVCCLTWFIFSPSNLLYWIILPINMSRLAVICIDFFFTKSEIKYVPLYIRKDNSYLSSLGFRMRRKSSLTGVC